MGIHVVFFLHVTTGPDNTNNVMALAFGVLIVILVVVGSLLVMADLNDTMMPAADLIRRSPNSCMKVSETACPDRPGACARPVGSSRSIKIE